MLHQLVFDDAEGQARAVDRNIELAENVRDRSDVVLVSVRKEKSAYPVCVFLKIGGIRDNEIDAEHILVREPETAVYHDYIVFVFDDREVLSDLVETSEHHYLEFSELLFSCHKIIFACRKNGRYLLP